MTRPADTYTVASGQPIYGGRAAPVPDTTYPFANTFAAEPVVLSTVDSPLEAYWLPRYTGKPVVLELHGSGGENYSTGTQYRVPVGGRMAYQEYTQFGFSLAVGGDDTSRGRYSRIRPIDAYGTYPGNGQIREGFFSGFRHMGTNDVTLITARRLDALMRWALANLADKFDFTRGVVTGGSMGADGCFTYGIRRPNWFASVYSDRGRWRYAGQTGTAVFVPTWDTNIETPSGAAIPNVAPEDGGGKFMDYQDGVAYVANPANKLPWIGWAMGTADGNYSMADHYAALQALRARKSGHCFVWNAGGHTTGPTLDPITASYPFGLFQVGKSYPYFFEHSLDANPLVDAAGGVNLNLTFRNVVDTAGVWSCEVTNISSACTVKVEPCNPVNFPAGAQAQLVTIPAANSWVTVTFTA